MSLSDLKRSGASERLMEVIEGAGYKELYPPQKLALDAGLLRSKDSFVVAAPTASGKTLIAEMATLDAFLKREGKTLYLVPLRALAGEKYDDFSKKYGRYGLKVMQSTGDYDSAAPWLKEADLIIVTNEKLDSLIRHRVPWLGETGLVVADEVHLIGDPHRGPTLEMVLTHMRYINPAGRMIALSATIPNAAELAGWLKARLIESDWRPVPLREGVYYNGACIFNDGSVKWIKSETGVDAVNLALDTIAGSGQALVFVNTRKAAESLAVRALGALSGLITGGEFTALKDLSERVLKASPEPTRLCRTLAECASGGAAFHHAGISYGQRKLVEEAFRNNILKLVVATTTLSMGLNLPSRRVIIRDWWRYEMGLGMQPLPVMEIKQMAGRAGRPGYDSYGEAVLVARNKRDERHLFEDYILGAPEDVESRLGSKPALRTHMLSLIAGAFTIDRGGLLDFLKKTFFAARSGHAGLARISERVVDFLISENMVTAKKEALVATRFGRRVSELYIDPLSGALIRSALSARKIKSDLALFHMLTTTPDMMVLRLKKKDIEEITGLFYKHKNDLLMPDEDVSPTEEILSGIKTASVLMDWVNEAREDAIAEHYDIGPGDLRTITELGDWLLYSAEEIGRIFRLKEEVRRLGLLRTRVRYGVKEELLSLVSLRGIGRVRARNLYNAGYRDVENIGEAPADELAGVAGIGRTLALDIKKQALGGMPPDRA